MDITAFVVILGFTAVTVVAIQKGFETTVFFFGLALLMVGCELAGVN